mgnify:FL=1|jgi:hypothetical protein
MIIEFTKKDILKMSKSSFKKELKNKILILNKKEKQNENKKNKNK